MNNRCISVNYNLENDFVNSLIYPQAVLIEDVNNDNKNEFIVGTSNGEILIYKNNLEKPWLKNSKSIGSITCLAFDSFTDSKQKYLIVHDAIGYVYFFTINQIWLRKRYASDISAAKSYPGDWKLDLVNVYQTKLLINPKFLLIDDIYHNGTKKMIIGYTDRTIRCYSWLSTAQSNTATNNTTSSINNLSKNNNSQSKGSLASQVASSYAFQENGKIILDESWELPDLIHSIQIFKDSLEKKHLLCSITGSQVLILHSKLMNDSIIESNSSSFSSLSQAAQILSPSNVDTLVNFSNEQSDSNNLSQPSYLVSNVIFNKMNDYAFLIKSNGEIYFFQITNIADTPNKSYIWHRNINVFVMKCFKFDINNDENEELLLATHDGQVFLVNCFGDIVCMDLGEPIKLFHMGQYSIESSSPITNLTENNASSEVDLHQCNPAFELALDSPPVALSKSEDGPNSHSLCFIFVSSITNKINFLQTDAILSYSKLKPLSHLNYRCENVFSYSQKFASKLNDIFNSIGEDNGNKKKCEILSQILYG